MSGRDKNKKKIIAADIKKNNTIRADHAAKENPSEKVAEYFKRKAYEKMNNQNTCKDTECPFYCKKQDCVAKEGCAGFTPKEQPSWKDRMMKHFMKGD